ncbi:MAG: hypothetical protein WA940_09170 [Sphingopyxis sp.]
MIPLWAYGAGGAALLAIGAAGGWTVRDWKADADIAKIERKLEDEAAKQRARADAAAASYEAVRSALDQRSRDTQTSIREYYRENPVNPDCAAGEPIVDGLRSAVEAANRAASGEPAPAL